MSTLSKQETESLTIVLSDDAVNYMHQHEINDVNEYVNQLLRQAKSQGTTVQDGVSASAPDASGYPQI